jgi:hypothetical protein
MSTLPPPAMGRSTAAKVPISVPVIAEPVSTRTVSSSVASGTVAATPTMDAELVSPPPSATRIATARAHENTARRRQAAPPTADSRHTPAKTPAPESTSIAPPVHIDERAVVDGDAAALSGRRCSIRRVIHAELAGLRAGKRRTDRAEQHEPEDEEKGQEHGYVSEQKVSVGCLETRARHAPPPLAGRTDYVNSTRQV